MRLKHEHAREVKKVQRLWTPNSERSLCHFFCTNSECLSFRWKAARCRPVYCCCGTEADGGHARPRTAEVAVARSSEPPLVGPENVETNESKVPEGSAEDSIALSACCVLELEKKKSS